MKKTSIIIVSYNNLNYLIDCINSIKEYTEKNTYEIIIIDNNSNTETTNWLKKQSDIKLILNKKNLGFPKACNQGIDIANKDNDILLLNNDTIVTTNWLKNLKICLYSDSKIGATGSVSNHNENLQGVDFTYSNFDEMQLKAKYNNMSDKNKWEQKNFLIGFCLLIKNEVIKKIKCIDEKYTPGYVDDNDLSLEIIKLGYKLMLCHDSFIHHYLGSEFRKDLTSFYKILNKNRNYFKKKWKFETYLFDEIKYCSIYLIKEKENKKFNILDLNSGIGTTILKLKYIYKNCNIDGVEKNKDKRNISKKFANIYSSINKIPHNKTYDYILIGNHLEKINNPNTFIKKIKKYLKPNGHIIGEINNASSYKNIINLLNDKGNRLYTITDIYKLFSNIGFDNFKEIHWLEAVDKDNMNRIIDISKTNYIQYQISYYSFKFQKK